MIEDRSQEQSLTGQLRELIRNLYTKLNVSVDRSKEKQFDVEVDKGTFLDNGLPESLVNALFDQSEQGKFAIRILPEHKEQELFWVSPIIKIVNLDKGASIECNTNKPYLRKNVLYFKGQREQMKAMINYKQDAMEEGPHAVSGPTEFDLIGLFEYKPKNVVEDLHNSIAFVKTIDTLARSAGFVQ